MPLSRGNPIGLQAIGELRTPPVLEQVAALVRQIEQTDKANAPWLRKQQKLIKLQYGPRRKREFPWPDASNISIPLIDGIVRRFRPGISSLVLDASPVATFTSADERDDDAARKAEPYWHWKFTEKMNSAKEILRLVDLYARRGHAYTREGWRYETDFTVRTVRVQELFPPTVQQWLESRRQAAEQEQRSFDPVDEIVRVLESEYPLEVASDAEGPELLAAARGILEGREYVRIRYREVIEDRPEMIALDPINVIADQDQDVQDGEFFVIVHHLSSDAIARMVRDGKFVPQQARAVQENIQKQAGNELAGDTSDGLREQIRLMRNQRAGLDKLSRKDAGVPTASIWEIFARVDVDGDGVKDRVVLWYAPATKTVLSLQPFSLSITSWPVTLYQFEAHAERPIESRGIPELLYDLQRLMNSHHNMRVDLGQLLLNPPLEYELAGLDFDTMPQWRPGAVFPVHRRGAFGQVQVDLRPLSQLLIEENQTQRIAESYIGTFDATITNLSAGRERRTASEVNAITQLAANVFGLDARMFQVAFGRTLSNLWSIWLDLGPEEEYFRVTGDEKPRLARKAEIGKHFDLKPAGTPSSTNRAFILGNIERILPLILQDQSGIFDRSALLRKWVQLIDPKLAESVVRSPEQTAQAQLVMQAAQIASAQGGASAELPQF